MVGRFRVHAQTLAHVRAHFRVDAQESRNVPEENVVVVDGVASPDEELTTWGSTAVEEQSCRPGLAEAAVPIQAYR